MRPVASIIQLGQLVRGFREARGLSQDEIAVRIPARANRSQVAHLEQGIRIPPSNVLRAICEFLGIPEAIWLTFESPEIRSRLNRGLSDEPIQSPRVIGVAGVMGSGKTTLAQQLARSLGYRYISESAHAKQYLPDLFQNPGRWAFETQLAFLLHKAVDIYRAVEQYPGIVIDRTLSEDIEIFAAYFHEKGDIDDRAHESYRSLASYFMAQLPSPDLIIYCDCDLDAAMSRVAERARSDLLNHTSIFVREIFERYKDWINTIHETSIYIADSVKWDWRDAEHITKIVRDLGLIYARAYFRPQVDLFDTETQTISSLPEVLQPYFLAVGASDSQGFFRVPAGGSGLLPYPAAYIAAPFTSFATNIESKENELFEKPHGEIKKGRFRTALLGIEKTLKKYGISSLIPHRDVNQWGKISLEPSQVSMLCSEQVSRTDLFIGIIAESHGAHYEFGLARGLGKPCIIIHCEELSESFVGSGFVNDGGQILSIECKKVTDIPGIIGSETVSEFIRRHF